jgi:CheY-like chemotaxis protein
MATEARPVVLLVEPHDDGRDMYVQFLRHQGFIPLAVSKAATALPFAPKADVIITGIRLPGTLNGYDFIERLRADERTKHIPIIVLTACVWTSERERAEDAGCDVFLRKPCLPSELWREVRRVLACPRARSVLGKSVKCDPVSDQSAHVTRIRHKRTA